MQKNFVNKLGRLLTERREWLPRLMRGHFLFCFTRGYRLVMPWNKNILLGKNVRVQWPTCLLAELPGSRIEVGNNTIIYEHAMIETFGAGVITIGENSVVGDNRIYSRGKISIGKRMVSSWNVMLQDFDPHPIDPDQRARQINNLARQFSPKFQAAEFFPEDQIEFDFSIGEIEIGDDVWLGANSIILKGAKIGSGSIVAAGAVVTKGDYPSNSILAGNPARIVKTIK